MCLGYFLKTGKVNRKYFDEIANGCSLNAEGKPLVVEHFIKYIDQDKIRYRGRNQTRNNALRMDAHAFANALLTD